MTTPQLTPQHGRPQAVPKQTNRARRAEALAGYLMISPAALLMIMFLFVPFFMAFGFAFTNQRLITPNPTEYVGMRNFRRLLTVRLLPIDAEVDPETGDYLLDEDGNYTYPRSRGFTRNNPEYPHLDGLQESYSWESGAVKYTVLAGDAVFLRSIANVLYFALVVIPLQGGLGLGLALMVNQKLKGINIFRMIFFIPVVISMVIVSILWRFIFDGNNGLLNSLLSMISWGAIEPIDWLGNERTSMPAIIMMSIWQGVGFHMVIWLAGLQTIPAVLYEAADVAGATVWQKFRYVTWPGLRPTFIFVLITITIAAFSLFTQVDIMTRGGPLDSTTTVIFQMVQRGYAKQDIAYGSAISVFYFIAVLIIALIQRYITGDTE